MLHGDPSYQLHIEKNIVSLCRPSIDLGDRDIWDEATDCPETLALGCRNAIVATEFHHETQGMKENRPGLFSLVVVRGILDCA